MSSNQTDSDQRGDREQKPRLRPTNPATLIVAGLGAAAVGWIMIARDYNDFPSLTWLPAFITVGLAVLEFVAALATKARIDRRPGTMPVDPLVAVRYVVLAKASSIVGALFAGFFGAVSIWLLADRQLAAASVDLPPAVGGFVGAIALLIAALLLERSCRVPPRPEDENETDEA